MFVRKKRNPSGVISVQVIDKSFDQYKMLKTIESSSDNHELERLVQLGHKWIREKQGLLSNQNISELQKKGYEFILGARIKNESQRIRDRILSHDLKNGESRIIEK